MVNDLLPKPLGAVAEGSSRKRRESARKSLRGFSSGSATTLPAVAGSRHNGGIPNLTNTANRPPEARLVGKLFDPLRADVSQELVPDSPSADVGILSTISCRPSIRGAHRWRWGVERQPCRRLARTNRRFWSLSCVVRDVGGGGDRRHPLSVVMIACKTDLPSRNCKTNRLRAERYAPLRERTLLRRRRRR